MGGKPKTDGVLAASAGALLGLHPTGQTRRARVVPHRSGDPCHGQSFVPTARVGRSLAPIGPGFGPHPVLPSRGRPRRHFIAPWRALWGAAPGHGRPPTATPSRPQAHGHPSRATSPRPLGPGHPGPPQGRLRAPSPRTATHPPLGACPQARPLFTANSLHCS